MSLAQDIESRINIYDVVSRYVQLKKSGVNYKGLCPFHSERSPSFVVSPQKNIAHCFSCGKGGGPINFIMEIEKIEFREAISVLAKEAGIELQTDYLRERADKGGDIYALYRETAAWYHRALFEKENERYLQYLTDREISRDTIAKFQLGCSTNSRDLFFFLKEKGFEPKFLMESGIFLSESRDKFFGRITFPIANHMGHVVAFTGRVLDDALPKYLNSPASHIFDKSSILYGMHLAKQSIAKTGEVYIVEGQMDTVMLHQAGIDNAVGISGTALTTDHIRMLKRSTQVIYLTLDADAAGVKATFASIENLANQDIEVRIIRIPSGKDPDEFIKSGGIFADLKKHSLTPIAFYLAEGGREYDLSTVIGKKKLIEKCLTFLIPIRSQIEVSLHISEMASGLGVSPEAISTEYKKLAQYTRKSQKSENEPLISPEDIPRSVRQPNSLDFLAGYIFYYDFFDLFFREFRYTLDDLPLEEDFSLLRQIITRASLDTEDAEYLGVIGLHLENTHPEEDRTSANVEKSFLDAVRSLHKNLLKREYQKQVEEHPEKTGEIFRSLLQKAQTLLPGEQNIQTIFR